MTSATGRSLSRLAGAADAEGFLEAIPSALELLSDYVDATRAKAVPTEKLVMSRRVSKRAEEYGHMNDGLAALMQLREEGLELNPGETVRYVVADARSTDHRRRVVAEQLASGGGYDEEAYVDLLARAAETLFLPFGYDREKLLSELSG